MVKSFLLFLPCSLFSPESITSFHVSYRKKLYQTNTSNLEFTLQIHMQRWNNRKDIITNITIIYWIVWVNPIQQHLQTKQGILLGGGGTFIFMLLATEAVISLLIQASMLGNVPDTPQSRCSHTGLNDVDMALHYWALGGLVNSRCFHNHLASQLF